MNSDCRQLSRLLLAYVLFFAAAAPVAASNKLSIELKYESMLIAQLDTGGDVLGQARTEISNKRLLRAQELLEALVASSPENEEARFLLARVLAWQNQFGDALKQYEILLGQSPHNADYHLGKAQVLYWSGKPREALPVIENARTLAPDYVDLWRLEIRILVALGGKHDIDRARRLREEAAARFPNEIFDPVHVAESPPEPLLNEIELTGSYDDLSDGRDPWRGISLRLSRNFTRRDSIYAVFRGTDRFSEFDQELRIGGYIELAEKWTLNLESSISPSHEVLERWSVNGTLVRELTGGWNVQFGIRHREYTRVDTNTGALTIERYWSNFRGAYSISGTHLDGASIAYTHTGQLDYFYDDRSSLGGFAFLGEEVESIGRNLQLVRDTHGFGLRGVHWFRPEWALTWLVEQQRIEDAFTRRGAFVGLRHRF